MRTVDLVDELTAAGEPVRACEVQFRSFGGHERFSGPVRTLRCREDNALLQDVLRAGGTGAVDVPVGFGAVTFTPDDDVFCDEDGVLVVARTP